MIKLEMPDFGDSGVNWGFGFVYFLAIGVGFSIASIYGCGVLSYLSLRFFAAASLELNSF